MSETFLEKIEITHGFSEPLWFLLILFFIPLFFAYKKHKPAIRFPSIGTIKKVSKKNFLLKSHIIFICRILTLFLLVLALARFQSGRSQFKQRTEGLDIMLVIDTSASMKAMDFSIEGKRRDRLFVVKKVLQEFIQKRADDRLGMVVFGSHAFAQAPLTLDHDVLLRYLEAVEIGMAGDATAIGDGLGVAINRLKTVKTNTKHIILLTDGSNTAGNLDPQKAAEIAKSYGVKIYTIGVGSNGMVPFPTPLGMQKVRFDLDEKALTQIAETTQGKYFRAQDTEALQDIYNTIDKLEKSEVEVKVHRQYDEKFYLFLWPALCFFLLELLFSMTRIRRIP